MIKLKTISGHYDTVYDLDHNNRAFTPRNVDAARTPWNYNCIAAGKEAYLNLEDPRHISEFWERYKELNAIYWENQSIARTLAYKRYQEHLEYMRRYSRAVFRFPHNPLEALITIFLLPLLIPCGIYLTQQQQKARTEWEQFQDEQWLQNMYFNAAKVSLRSALYAHDHVAGTQYLYSMDTIVAEMTQRAENYAAVAKPVVTESKPSPKHATLEEIYDKLFEPSFQEFQLKQRPCRRYNGTYLEQILSQSLEKYQDRVEELISRLDTAIDRQWQNATNQDIIAWYLQVCTDAEYNAIVDKAANCLNELAVREQERVKLALDNKIHLAAQKMRSLIMVRTWYDKYFEINLHLGSSH